MSDHTFGLLECGCCRYAVPTNVLSKTAPMQCRRHPPICYPVPQQGGMGQISLWPLVSKGDSCGDGLPKLGAPVGESMPVRFNPPDSVNGGEPA